MPVGAPLGNDNGKRGKLLTDQLKQVMARSGDGDMTVGARKVVQAAYDAALAGEQWAIKEIWDRMEGKPGQQVTVANDETGKFSVESLIRTIVDPKHRDA